MKHNTLVRVSRISAKFCLWTAAVLSGAVAIVLTILTLKLSAGPISLDFAKSSIEASLSNQDAHLQTQIGNAMLRWNSAKSRLEVLVNNVSLRETQSTTERVLIPSLTLNFKLNSLLKLEFIPKSIEVSGLQINLLKQPDGNLAFTNPLSSQNDPPFVDGILFLLSLKALAITDSKISITDVSTEQTWTIPNAEFKLSRKGPRVLASGVLKPTEADINFSATAIITNQKITIDAQGTIKNLMFDNLHKLWPQPLAPKPRKWVLENLSAGKVPEAVAKLAMTIDLTGPKPQAQLDDINGHIKFNDMTINYFDGLPPVTAVDGMVRFDKQHLYVDTKNGKLRDLRVTESTMVIRGMDVEDQDMEVDLIVKGPVRDALTTIDKKPLELAKKFKVQPQNVSGEAYAKLHVAFPLETDLSLEQVTFKVDADIKQLAIANILGKDNVEINLSDGACHLLVDKNELKASGKSKLNGVATDISWHEKFHEQGAWKCRYHLSADIDGEDLIKFQLPQVLDGKAQIDFEYIEQDDHNAKIITRSDITNASFVIPNFGPIKSQGQECIAKAQFEFHNQKLSKIPELKLKGQDIDINLIAKLSKKTSQLKSLECPKMKFGNNDLSLLLSYDKSAAGTYYIDLKGSMLDLEPFLKNFAATPYDNNGTPFIANMRIDQVRFGDNKTIQNLYGTIAQDQQGRKNISLESNITGRTKTKPGRLSITQRIQSNGETLHITSNNAGEVLRLISMSDTATNGRLIVKAHKPTPNAPWIGKLVVRHFHLSKAPVMTQLLSLASPFGLFDAVNGKVVSFHKFHTNFKLDDHQIVLQDGVASGTSLGLTVAGEIDRKNDALKLYGTVLPANFLNMILVKIPLIGKLLGGKGGGIWGVSYHMTGTSTKPKVSVNPFSALTPGFLRKIFHPKSLRSIDDDDSNLEDEEDTDETEPSDTDE